MLQDACKWYLHPRQNPQLTNVSNNGANAIKLVRTNAKLGRRRVRNTERRVVDFERSVKPLPVRLNAP